MILFTAIGDLFTGSSWFHHVIWPFWMLLSIIAIGGVYTARFQRNTLFCRGMQGALKLALIYMVVILGYVLIPSYMFTVSQFPFMSVTEETLTLVNPLGLVERWKTALPEVSVRLYFLLFLINAVGTFDYNGKNPLVWLGLQVVSCAVPVGIFEAISAFVIDLWPLPDSWLHNSLAILLVSVALTMLLLKLFFLVTKKTGNHTYSMAYQFFTTQRIGSLFTTSFLSFLIVLVFLVIVNLFHMSRMALANFNQTAFFLIGFMCMIALAIYNMLFTERKP